MEAEDLQKLIVGFHFPTQQLASNYKFWHSKELLADILLQQLLQDIILHPTEQEHEWLLFLEMPSQTLIGYLQVHSKVLGISLEKPHCRAS